MLVYGLYIIFNLNAMQKDIDFLYEIGRMRFMQRAWQRFFSTKVANDTEHTFRVIWLALLISNKEKKGNQERIMKLALAHDISESRSMDVDYMSRQYVKRNEEQAVYDTLSGTTFEKEFIELSKEMEKRETIEAKIVKDADNLDIDLELMEQRDANEKIFQSKTKGQKNCVTSMSSPFSILCSQWKIIVPTLSAKL
ncbi:MAG: HD domain-containing protein [Candidatus Moraniibacteriota bacterium]